MGKDAAFLEDFAKVGIDMELIPPAEVTELVARNAALPAALVARMRALVASN